MSIRIVDQHLEDRIDRERQRRGDATQAKTLADLAREKLTEIELRCSDELAGEGRAVAHPGIPAGATQ